MKYYSKGEIKAVNILSFTNRKYDRCKGIIEGYKCNEETLRQNLTLFEERLHKNEEKYEALKAHAKAQLER